MNIERVQSLLSRIGVELFRYSRQIRKSYRRWYYNQIFSRIGQRYMEKFHNELVYAKQLWSKSNSVIMRYYLEDKRNEYVAGKHLTVGQKEAVEAYIKHLTTKLDDLDDFNYYKYALRRVE